MCGTNGLLIYVRAYMVCHVLGLIRDTLLLRSVCKYVPHILIAKIHCGNSDKCLVLTVLDSFLSLISYCNLVNVVGRYVVR